MGVSPVLEDRSYRHGDHVCWIYDSPDEFRHGAIDFLTEGARGGEQLLFVGDGELGLDDLVDSGQLATASPGSLGGEGGDLDPARQVERYRSLTEAALAAGRAGLRVLSDATSLATEPGSRHAYLACELALDRYIARSPVTALCGFRRDAVGAGAGEVACVHRGRAGVGTDDPGFSLVSSGDEWQLEGEVDLSNREAFRASLRAAASVDPEGDVLLDLSRLGFADVASVADLIDLRETIGPRHLAIRDPNAVATRIAEPLGWLL